MLNCGMYNVHTAVACTFSKLFIIIHDSHINKDNLINMQIQSIISRGQYDTCMTAKSSEIDRHATLRARWTIDIYYISERSQVK